MKKVLIALGLDMRPIFAFAQNQNNGAFEAGGGLNSSADGLVTFGGTLTKVANALIPFLLAVAVVVFIYGVIKYILAEAAEDKSVARGYIIYGIIGIAVIVSLFGLIKLLQGTDGIDPSAKVNIPQFPTTQ